MSSDDLPIVTLDPRLGPAAAASDPLSDDAKQRVRELGTQVIARYPRPRSALMPLLYLVVYPGAVQSAVTGTAKFSVTSAVPTRRVWLAVW